jgi:cbb3-type cytochrome oxidase maturation protein
MDSLYLLIPLSLLLVLAIGGLLAWSVLGGQFDELENEGQRILTDEQRHENPDANLAANGADPSVRGATVHRAHGEDRPGGG